MKKLLVVLLLMVGTFAFATEGEWTWSSEGGCEISYPDSQTAWSAFNQLTEDCELIDVVSQLKLPACQGFRIVANMWRFRTELWVFDGYYVSYYVIYK